jgi:2-polyprenyl-6-methoxyphenol hydroxylase-like FAD-dependent oxidoreductase
MTESNAGPAPDFDVVIVGGRPAGASLAARLGARGRSVLVVDRATFPSLPAVPSSPVLYPSAMHLLDEMGLAEEGYGDPLGRMDALAFQFHTWFSTVLRLPPMFGRNYVYGIDRRQFDLLLWKNLERFPSVTRREGFSVTEVLRDSSGRVEGVVGKPGGGGAEERIRARCVVGADGRYSKVARAVGANVVEEEAKHVSTAHYADWKGVAPLREDVRCGHLYTTGRGTDVLIFCMAGGVTSVNTHIRADHVPLGRDPQEHYLGVLRSFPAVARRLAGAEQVTPLFGMRRIGNGYRKASGPGWALVGDALHFKDPVDGQGIYDALIEAKLLDEALGGWLSERQGWDEAMAGYERRVMEETHPMYVATIGRLRRELYSEPPVPVIRTLIRWTMSDPEYQERFLLYLGRIIRPDQAITPGVTARAVLRGLGRDVRGLWRRGRDPEEKVSGA